MSTTKRCSSCKLYRRIELFQKPLSNSLFNTCENCRIKKKNNYHRQKLRQSLKDMSCDQLVTSSPVTTSYTPVSLIKTEDTAERTFPTNTPVSIERMAPVESVPSSAEPLPKSTWICSSYPPALHVIVAKALFHYTLYNPNWI